MSDKDVKKFLDAMIKSENGIVKSINDSIDAIENLAVRSALKGVSYDSMKHSEIYRSAMALLDERRPTVDEGRFDAQRDLLSRHITMEERLIRELERMMPRVEDEKVSFLLGVVLNDERRHHKMLKRLHEFLVRDETITEEDWWDAVWRDVPGLWT
jgi:hypothetical protein